MERTPKLRLLSAFLALAIMLTVLPTAAFAEDAGYTGYGKEGTITMDDGLHYEVNTDGNTVTLVGSDLGLTDVKIPSEVENNGTTYKVTAIGSYAFWHKGNYKEYNETLSRVNIADTVTSIGERAFFNCSKLTSIKIPKVYLKSKK